MKYFLSFIVLLLSAAAMRAQQPAPVYGYARVNMPIAWYKEQSAAWQQQIRQNPGNAKAWYYYYYAERILKYNDQTDSRSPEEKDAAIEALMMKMGKAIPGSYEYNLCRWLAGGGDMKLLPYLNKAVALGPERTEHIDCLINMGELDRDIAKRDLYAQRKFDAGEISTGMMYYNYNVIAGTAQNAIIITCGDNDTYPVWVLQAQGIRKDITVLNLSLLYTDEYRNKIFRELGVEQMNPGDYTDQVARDRYKKELIRHIAANKRHYPVYVGLTAAGFEPYTSSVEDRLYLTGLAYLYSEQPVDNIALLKKNFEQQYTLDYLEHSFYKDISSGLVKEINRNYIVPMLKLYEHYKVSGEGSKEDWIKRKLLQLSSGTAEETEIRKHLAKL